MGYGSRNYIPAGESAMQKLHMHVKSQLVFIYDHAWAKQWSKFLCHLDTPPKHKIIVQKQWNGGLYPRLKFWV